MFLPSHASEPCSSRGHHDEQRNKGTGGSGQAAGGFPGGEARQGKRGWRRWARTIALEAAAVVLALTSTTLVAGAVAKARLKSKYPPIGQMVDVGGNRLHVACQGSGSPSDWPPRQQRLVALPEVKDAARSTFVDRQGIAPIPGFYFIGPP